MKSIAFLALLPALALTACQLEISKPNAAADVPGAASAPEAVALGVTPIGVSPVGPALPPREWKLPPLRLHCAATAPFTSVAPVAGISSGQVSSVALTTNELELYATVPIPSSSLSSLVRMVRASRLDPFVLADEPNVVSKTGFYSGVGLSRDGLALYVSVPVPNAVLHAPAGMELQVAHRASTADRFGALSSAGLDAAFPWHITQMTPSPAGDSLFASVSVAGVWRIQEIPLAAPVFDLSGAHDVFAPSPVASGIVPTESGQYAYVGQQSWVGDAALLFSVALAAKPAGASMYGVPVVLGAPVNTGGNGGVPQWLSSDECSLYYIAVSPGGSFLQLNVARK